MKFNSKMLNDSMLLVSCITGIAVFCSGMAVGKSFWKPEAQNQNHGCELTIQSCVIESIEHIDGKTFFAVDSEMPELKMRNK